MLNRLAPFYLLMLMTLTGCAGSLAGALMPTIKDNIALTPIKVEIDISTYLAKPERDKFVNEATLTAYRFTDDKIATDKAQTKAQELYDKNFSAAEVDVPAVLSQAFTAALARPSDYSYKASYLDKADFNKPAFVHNGGNNFTGSTSNSWASYDNFRKLNDTYNITGNINIESSGTVNGDKMQVNIYKVGYKLDCILSDRNGNYLCSHHVYGIKDDALLSALAHLPAPPSNYTYTALMARQSIETMLKNRYQLNSSIPSKSEKYYPVDFATAKARIQRALDKFEYDEKTSTFSFTYTHPFKTNTGKFTPKHTFAIALFPENKGTVVQFSGKYDYLTDTFTDKVIFGEPDFLKGMAVYSKLAAERLGK